MRFALLGDHPDGLDMARALAESGRHHLGVYHGPALGMEYLRRWGLEAARLGDLEEILADPAIEAVIVAGRPGERPAQLRRALQSERHILCVHPADHTPDIGYEAAMIQADTRMGLFPLLPEPLHPGIRRLAELIESGQGNKGQPALFVEAERCASDQILLDAGHENFKVSLPGWEVLRRLGGEIVEIMGLSSGDEIEAGDPVLLAGRFEGGGLFRASLLPRQPENSCRFAVFLPSGRCELLFGQGWPGPACLRWVDDTGRDHTENWGAWNPWPAVVEAWEADLQDAGNPKSTRRRGPGEKITTPSGFLAQAITENPDKISPTNLSEGSRITWLDEIRCLELDDAARRSVERHRASTLEFQEAFEEASFKGTMTLVGCSLLWVSLVFLILSIWVPWLAWLIIPVFAFFLLLQLLRWVVPPDRKPGT